MRHLKQLPILVFGFYILFSSGCNQHSENQNDNNLLPTDLVENPISANDTDGNNTSDLPKIKFIETSHDFGVLVEGEKVAHNFKFKNTGNTDLIITNASSTCGCTISNYPKEPIKPNEEAAIEVVFNSSGKAGIQNKRVTILANTIPNRTYLDITAEVVAPNQIKN